MPHQDELCRIARLSGAALLGELEQARVATHDWTDVRQADALVAESLQNCLDKLSATGCWGEANRLASGELWKVAGGVLALGPLQLQARQKPRGYAGDFELLDKICQRWKCSHPLGRAFDQFFQDQSAPESVRQRTRIVADQMALAVRRALARGSKAAHVVSVGAGPAHDIRLGLERLDEMERRGVIVSLLDMDPAALEFAATRLRSLIAADQLRLHRENLFRLPRLARLQSLLAGADFISCPGLFDYLDGESASAMLSCFWNRLRRGGEAIIFNFAPSNDSRAYMEWIGNWYLTYRGKPEITELAQVATYPDAEIIVSSEPSGTSLFAVCQKV